MTAPRSIFTLKALCCVVRGHGAIQGKDPRGRIGYLGEAFVTLARDCDQPRALLHNPVGILGPGQLVVKELGSNHSSPISMHHSTVRKRRQETR